MPLDKLMAALRRSAGRPDRRCTGISLLTWHDLGWSPLPIVTFDARPTAWVSSKDSGPAVIYNSLRRHETTVCKRR